MNWAAIRTSEASIKVTLSTCRQSENSTNLGSTCTLYGNILLWLHRDHEKRVMIISVPYNISFTST